MRHCITGPAQSDGHRDDAAGFVGIGQQRSSKGNTIDSCLPVWHRDMRRRAGCNRMIDVIAPARAALRVACADQCDALGRHPVAQVVQHDDGTLAVGQLAQQGFLVPQSCVEELAMLKDLHRRRDIGLCGDRRDIGEHTRTRLLDERRHIGVGDGIGRQNLPLALVVLEHSIAAYHDARRPLLLDHAIRLGVGLAPQRIKAHQREATRRQHCHRQPACSVCLPGPSTCQQRGQPDEASIEFEEVVCIRPDFADADAYQHATDGVSQCHRQTDRIVMQRSAPTTEQHNASPCGNDQQRPMNGQQFLPKPPCQRILPAVDIRLDQVQPQIGTRQPQCDHNTHQHCCGTPHRTEGDPAWLDCQPHQERKRRSNEGRFGQ